MELYQADKQEVDLLKPKEYSKEVLEQLIYDSNLKAAEISELFGKDEKGNPVITPNRIYKDMKRWGISPEFIQSISLTALLETTIQDCKSVIAKYSKDYKATYRKLEEVVNQRLIINQQASAAIAGQQIDVGTIADLVADDINLSELIKFQQKDEEIVHSYYKLMLDAIKELRAARALQIDELDMEAMLSIIYRELYKLDEQHNFATNYAMSFYVNVKRKMFEKIGQQKVITKSPEIKKLVAKMANEKEKRNKPTKEEAAKRKADVMNQYKKEVMEIAEQYDVHYQVALRAKALKTENPSWELEKCVKAAIPLAVAKYKYLDINGKAKPKGGKNNEVIPE